MSEEETETPADARLSARMAAMTSPDHLIAAAVAEACGSPLATKTRIAESFSNEVYAATTADRRQVIVRVHWYQGPHFEAERWALAQCARLALPVPEIFLVRHGAPDEEPRSVCVESRLPGVTLHAMLAAGTLDPSDLHPLLVAAGAFLARLHTVPTSGFGRIDATGHGPGATWEAYRSATPRDQLHRAARNLGLPTAEIDGALDLLQAHAWLWDGMTPRLLHGDFSPQNMLVHEGQLSGVIDFEYPASGDPAMDLAYWDYFRHSPFHNPTGAALPTEWLLEGYRQHEPPTFALHLAACRLQLGLDLLGYHGVRDDQDPRFLAFIATSFRRDLADLRQHARAGGVLRHRAGR